MTDNAKRKCFWCFLVKYRLAKLTQSIAIITRAISGAQWLVPHEINGFVVWNRSRSIPKIGKNSFLIEF